MYYRDAYKMSTWRFIAFYRSILNQSKRGKAAMIPDRKETLRCQSLIWDVIAKSYMRNDGGVYIDNVGYFCHLVNPKRMYRVTRWKDGTVAMTRQGRDGYNYIHSCYDFKPNNTYFRIELSARLKIYCDMYMNKGKRYKFLYREVDSERGVFAKGRVIKLRSVKRKVKS